VGIGGKDSTCGAWCRGQPTCAIEAVPLPSEPCIEHSWYHILAGVTTDVSDFCEERCLPKWVPDGADQTLLGTLADEINYALGKREMTLTAWEQTVAAYRSAQAMRQRLSAALAAAGAHSTLISELAAKEPEIDSAIAAAAADLSGAAAGFGIAWRVVIGAVAIVAGAGAIAYVAAAALSNISTYLLASKAIGVCDVQADKIADERLRQEFLVKCLVAAKTPPSGANWAFWLLLGGGLALAAGAGVWYYKKRSRA
jgi:hypothetical protein